MNCQITGLASTMKGLGTEITPFLVSSYSIIASKNVSGSVSNENFESPGKTILPIRRGPVFANPEGSQFANPEESCFCQSGGVLFLPIRRGPNFANPEGSCFCQSGGVLFLPILRGPVFANPDGYYFIKT